MLDNKVILFDLKIIHRAETDKFVGALLNQYIDTQLNIGIINRGAIESLDHSLMLWDTDKNQLKLILTNPELCQKSWQGRHSGPALDTPDIARSCLWEMSVQRSLSESSFNIEDNLF